MNIYVINLKSRPDRYTNVKCQLDRLNLHFELFPAINGYSLTQNSQNIFKKFRFTIEQKKRIVPGEMGCAISHRTIWKKMINENIRYALILEDDIEINEGITDFLDQIQQLSFDFINLSDNKPYKINHQILNRMVSNNQFIRPFIWERKKRNEWKKLEWRRRWRIFQLHVVSPKFIICECDPAPALGSGYLLSLHGAKSLLKTTENMYYPIDLSWRYSAGMLREGFLATPLIKQNMPGDTNIKGRYVGYKLNIIQKILRFFLKSRRLKRRWDVLRMYGIFRR